MAEYIVKNLDKNISQEVRIYRIDKNSTIIPVENFHILNDLSGSVSVRLRPDYTIECVGAFNTVGVLESTITPGTQLTTIDGDVTTVESDVELVDILKVNYGLSATILEDYIPPVLNDNLTFTVQVSDNTIPYTVELTSEDGMDFTADVDWGDGVIDTLISTDGTLNAEHTYSLIDAKYTVKIINNKPLSTAYIVAEIDEVTNWGRTICRNFQLESAILTKVPDHLPDYVTSTSYMFANCINFNQDISTWNTSNVTDMSYMFAAASNFNQPIGGWNVSNVTNMQGMFENTSSFDQDISTWDTSNVTSIYSIFGRSIFNQPLDTWDVSKVTNMAYAFVSATNFNQPIGSWNTSLVNTMKNMFYGATNFNQDISSWNVSKVTDMNNMFAMTSEFNQNLSQWCVPLIIEEPAGFAFNTPAFSLENYPVWGTCPRGEDGTNPITADNEMYFTTLAGTIDYSGNIGDTIYLSDGSVINLESNLAENITLPAGTHKVVLADVVDRNDYVGISGEALIELVNFPTLSSVTSFDFSGITSSPNLTTVPTTLPSNIINIAYMFRGASLFNQDISSWDVSNVTDMSNMFEDASLFNQDISSWDTSKVSFMAGMFWTAANFNQPLNLWDTSNVTDMSNMFRGASLFNQDISSWNTSNVTDMSYMFRGASLFNQDISLWNTSKVTNMKVMFNNAYIFNQNIGNWDVSKVTDMNYMFALASEFNQDLSQWCVGLITDEPTDFNIGGILQSNYKPVWGTCPRGENIV